MEKWLLILTLCIRFHLLETLLIQFMAAQPLTTSTTKWHYFHEVLDISSSLLVCMLLSAVVTSSYRSIFIVGAKIWHIHAQLTLHSFTRCCNISVPNYWLANRALSLSKPLPYIPTSSTHTHIMSKSKTTKLGMTYHMSLHTKPSNLLTEPWWISGGRLTQAKCSNRLVSSWLATDLVT